VALTADFQMFEEIHLMQGKTNGIGFHSSINVLPEAHPAIIKLVTDGIPPTTGFKNCTISRP
jgi:hypothetical protein